MSRHDPKVTPQQPIAYAQRAQLLCMNRTLDELLADWQTTWTFERAMQLLGESVKRLPRELCNRYPAVDWKAIAGMRDNITHGYDSIDYEIFWKAVQTQVPELLVTLNKMVERSQGTIEINGAPCAPYRYWNRCVSSGLTTKLSGPSVSEGPLERLVRLRTFIKRRKEGYDFFMALTD